MNILPKNYGEFQSKEYWDKFFRKLKKQNAESEYFEWYGSYKSFEAILNSNIITADSKILNVGCGNSLFSEDLYDGGFKNIVNCDFSEDVIKDMSARSAKLRPQMRYEVMDIFNMTYSAGSFDAILDKGLLDAVYPEDTEANSVKITGLLDKISEIMSASEQSRYVCVSLLQKHILNMILGYYFSKNFEITIYEVLIEKSTLYPFLVDIKRSATSHNKVRLFLKASESCQLLTAQEAKHAITRVQTQNRFMTQVKKCSASQRFSIEVWDPKQPNAKVPKYTLHIVDSASKKTLENKTCGCFITPQGKEQSYISSTEKGNFELLDQTGLSRLIIAILNPGYVFTNLKDAQDELSPAINDLTPKGCKNLPVPFMTDGDDLGEKDVIVQNDEFIIEEILNEDGHALRRLVLKNNISAIQSQYKMTYFSSKNKPELVEQNKLSKSILPFKKNMVIGIDESYLDSEVHRAMIAGLSLMNVDAFAKKDLNVLVLGGGLCAISKFLYLHFANTKITSIEISKAVVEAAKTHFNIDKDPRFKIVIDNAISYVKNMTMVQEKVEEKSEAGGEEVVGEEEESKSSDVKKAEEIPKKSAKASKQFDIIIVDVISSVEGIASPPEQFLQGAFLDKIKAMLVDNTGILMVNYIGTHEKESKELLQNTLSKTFDVIYSFKTGIEFNEVIFAMNIDLKRSETIDNNNAKEELIIVEREQIKQKKDLEINFKAIMKTVVKPWDFTLNIESMCSQIALRYPLVNAGSFQRTNVFLNGSEGSEMINNTKAMYENDLGKVVKKEKKKSKNKKK